MGLNGRSVVVTGGTGALGRAVVGRLLEQGATCQVPVFDPAELEGYPHTGHANLTLREGVDLTQEGMVETYFGALPSLWASIHITGGFDMAPLADASQAHFARLFDMNALTCFLCCREAVKAMRRGGAGQGGRIVNVAARPALEPRTGKGMVAYTGAKAAVAAMTQAMAEELAGESIAVNAIAPSIIDTPANRSAMPKSDHSAWPKPDEIAEAVMALVGAESSVVRGAIVTIYGRA